MKALKRLLKGYVRKKNIFLLRGFKEGFRLGNDVITYVSMPRISDSVDLDPELIRNKIEAEVKAGRMAGPFKSPPFSPFHVSPISLREKSVPNTYRLIHNLSYIPL